MKSSDSWQRALVCSQAALDKKAYDLVLLEVSPLTTVADYFLICTGRSDIQVQAICRAIEEAMIAIGVKPLAIEGFTNGQWVLMDFGDVIVHVFYETARHFYNLEGFWSQAHLCPLPEPYQSQAQHLRIAHG